MRESDILARYGGDEFVVVLPETPPSGALVIAERIRKRHRGALASWQDQGLAARISASFGIASYPDHALTPEGLIQKADQAMYRVKERDKNGIEVAVWKRARTASDRPLSIPHRPLGETSASMNLRSIVNLSFLSSDLAIDLGTANTLVYAKNKGIVVSGALHRGRQQGHGQGGGGGQGRQGDAGPHARQHRGHPSHEGRGHRRLRDHREDAQPLHPQAPTTATPWCGRGSSSASPPR